MSSNRKSQVSQAVQDALLIAAVKAGGIDVATAERLGASFQCLRAMGKAGWLIPLMGDADWQWAVTRAGRDRVQRLEASRAEKRLARVRRHGSRRQKVAVRRAGGLPAVLAVAAICKR